VGRPSAPFKELSRITPELLYGPLSIRSVPVCINMGGSVRQLQLFDSALAGRDSQMGVLDLNPRIYTHKLENISQHCIRIGNVLIEPYDLNATVRKILSVDTDVFPVPTRLDNIWLSANHIIYGVFNRRKTWRGHPLDVSRFHSVKGMTD